MNTPDPCNICLNLYYDALSKDDPAYEAECKLNLEMGNKQCSSFIHYRSQNKQEQSFGDILRNLIVKEK